MREGVAQREWFWPDEAACAANAAALAAALAGALALVAPAPSAAAADAPHAAPAVPGPPRDATIELHGPLGAGKTTFVRHLLRALGVRGRIKSPTYTVVEPYRAGELEISHFDFYRFDDARELLDAGLREMFAAPGLKLVEWPSRVAALLPRADLRIEIEPQADDSRRVRALALTPRGVELLG